MSCITLKGGNNPGNSAHVTAEGQVKTLAVTLSEESRASEAGELFNFGSGIQTITDDVDTPLFYLKNVGENRDLKISSIIFTLGPSTGAAGQPVTLYLHRNVDSGTILNQPNIPSVNFNIGSGNILDVDSKIGGAGFTMSSEFALPTLFPSDSQRYAIDVDSIVVPRGRSVGVSVKAATGNTSMLVSVSVRYYLKSEEL